MPKILIYKYIDIYNKTDYVKLSDTVKNKFHGVCPNFGNKLWFQGLISEISVDGNSIDYYNSEMKIDAINEEYDCVIYPMANIFSLEYASGLSAITSFIKQLKIPVYIISCGLQCKSFDDIDAVIQVIGNDSKQFIKAVYDSGGEFALRGYYTAEFFSRLGFNDAKVVGCPSLFQSGKDLSVSNDKVDIKDFKLGVNGSIEIARTLADKYRAVFYDQEALFNYMYNRDFYKDKKPNLINNLKWIKSSGIGIELADWIVNSRIRLLADMWDWQHSFQSAKISFSYGTRIHGNIMAVLSGVPALIVNVDARVKEMAEFYEIPNIEYTKALEIKENGNDIYSLYIDTDYSNFNKNFEKKYNAFTEFMINCGIIKNSMNSDNPFLNCSDGNYPVSAIKMSQIRAEKIQQKKSLYSILLSLI